MDFLKSKLHTEIEKQKRNFESVASGKKYVRRSEIEKEREEKYRQEQAELEAQRSKALQAHLLKYKDENKISNPRVKKEDVKKEEPEQQDSIPEYSDIVAFFRARKLPLTLFGESSEERIERYRNTLDRENSKKVNVKKEAIDEATLYNVEFIKTLNQVEEKGETAMETDPINPALVLTEREKTKALIIVFFQRILKEWEAELAKRDSSEKLSINGRNATSALEQAHEFIKPLFRLLQNDKGVDDDVAQSIGEMCYFMQHRDYVKANDAYMKLAIGNAPWPIGVVGVGIHERSASDRIGANQIARNLFL